MCFCFTSNRNCHVSLKKRRPPKLVVDFLLEKDAFRKIMEIVEDVDGKRHNNNGKPWKSSRILRGSFFHLLLFYFFYFPCCSFFHFSFFHFFQNKKIVGFVFSKTNGFPNFFFSFVFPFFLFFFHLLFLYFFFQSSNQTPEPGKIVEKFSLWR